MRGSSIVLMAMIAVLCFVGPAATAATVTLDLRDNQDGTFDLYATATLGDNAGISFFNIDLVNILTATHQSPKGVDMDAGFITRGFTSGGPDLTGDGALFAYQNTLDLPTCIFGIGQTAGTMNTAGSPRGIPWAVPVLLASGTYDGVQRPWQDYVGTEYPVNVFTAVDDPDVEAATVVWIPEPATMAVLALGAGLFMLRRRR